MSFEQDRNYIPGAKIKVIGIGGGGSNAINTMIREGIEGVDFITANTDLQSLQGALSNTKVQVGKELTKGLGAGADPDIGRDAALEDRSELHDSIGNSDMVFVTAGMGGGTGTGGAPVIAQLAREQGALTVGVVTQPFSFEGRRRLKHAESGIERLKEHVDTLIVIPNEKLLKIATPDLSMIDAFKMADFVLVNAVRGISDIINIPGTVNVDFADVKAVMSGMGQALMGIGTASGPNRAVEAATQAINSPLLEDINIEGATGILINISAGANIGILELNEAASVVQEAAHEDANIIFGAVIEEGLEDQLRVTVIATGFPNEMVDGREANTVKHQTGKTTQSTFAANMASHSSSIPTAKKEVPAQQPVFRTEEPVNEPQNLNSEKPALPLEKPLEPKPLPKVEPVTQTPAVGTREHEALAALTLSENNPMVSENHESVGLSTDTGVSDPLDDLKETTFLAEDEIEKTIDQALEITEKVKYLEQDDEDDLDIPSFLRDSGKEANF